MTGERFDTLIRNAQLARPGKPDLERADIGIRDGKIAAVAPGLSADQADDVVDATGLIAFPGLVDAHMHTGIYAPLDEDARTESRAAAMGGVTTSINYIRTGKYYLNKGGSYLDFFPEVLQLSEGNFHVDYAYHLAPMTSGHINEIEPLIEDFGVTSFKIFMFYGGYGLHGRSNDQSDFLMIGKDEKYDFAHFEFIMRGIKRAADRFPDIADRISLSLHCETAEIMAAYTKLVERRGDLSGLAAYSASRPPHSEGLAVCIASYLAHETECANINLLHLSGRKAVEAAVTMSAAFPHVQFRREVTIGHLLLDIDSPCGNHAKVNPPIRPREDVEYLWDAVLDGKIDWVVSDHACCRAEMKVDPKAPGDVFVAKSGFGGTEYLLSGLITEGRRRGLSYNRMSELVSRNPAERYGVVGKGDLAEGFDADIALVDPNESFVVSARDSESAQGYTPFEGMELTAKVKSTYLRGNQVWNGSTVVGPAAGRYLRRNSG